MRGRMWQRAPAWAAAILFCSVAAGASLPVEPAALAPQSPTRVIARLHSAPGASLLLELERRGADVNGVFPLLGVVALSLPRGDLAWLAARPEVRYVTADRPIRAVEKWPVTGRDWAALLAVTSQRPLSAAEPAGVALIGPRPEAENHTGALVRLIPLAALDRGEAMESSVLAAMEAALRMREARRIRMLVLGFTSRPAARGGGDPMGDAVRQALAAGILVVESGPPPPLFLVSRPALYRIVPF